MLLKLEVQFDIFTTGPKCKCSTLGILLLFSVLSFLFIIFISFDLFVLFPFNVSFNSLLFLLASELGLLRLLRLPC